MGCGRSSGYREESKTASGKFECDSNRERVCKYKGIKTKSGICRGRGGTGSAGVRHSVLNEVAVQRMDSDVKSLDTLRETTTAVTRAGD